MSNTPSVLISLVTWNSKAVLPSFLDSLLKQTFHSWELVIVDNASTDGTAETISDFRFQIADFFVIQNDTNRGFAAAHNQAIRLAIERGREAVLVVNPDIVLEQTCLEHLVSGLQSDSSVGSVGARLYRLTKSGKSDIVDSFGIGMTRSRHVYNIEEGDRDDGSMKRGSDVFGVIGALALYRCRALTDCAVPRGNTVEFFDEDFFAYKEDVDLAWRLSHNGWKARIVREALAYHAHSVSKTTKRRDRAFAIRVYSYRNHLLMIAKNEEWTSFLLHAPWILFREFAKAFFLLCTDPYALVRGFYEFCTLLPLIIRKRPWTHRHR